MTWMFLSDVAGCGFIYRVRFIVHFGLDNAALHPKKSEKEIAPLVILYLDSFGRSSLSGVTLEVCEDVEPKQENFGVLCMAGG